MPLKLYELPVSWEVCGYLKVYAKNLQEAIERAYDENTQLPDANYIDGSFKVDMEDGQILSDMYPNERFNFNIRR